MTNQHAPLALRGDAPTEKRCARCTELLPLSSFYSNANKIDGCSHYCVNCEREYMAEYRQRTKERRSEYIKQWKTTPKGREGQRRDSQALRRQRPEVIVARNTLNHAVERGEVLRQPCQFCGNPKSEAHHGDYSKPLDVIWACFKCHREQIHGQTVVAKDTAP